MRALAGGDAHVECDSWLLASEVVVDTAVLRLVLEEALANARKYGRRGTPIIVSAAVLGALSKRPLGWLASMLQ